MSGKPSLGSGSGSLHMPTVTGIRLSWSNGQPVQTSLPAVNQDLQAFGARVSPLPNSALPPSVHDLLARRALTSSEAERVKHHFLLSREQLLEVIAGAGRTPRVPGGGALVTHGMPADQDYPQLYLAEAGSDYSRFDRFHVNAADDGTGVDEILQLLSGGGIEHRRLLPDGTIMALRLDCPDEGLGWLLTYDGSQPHVTSLTGASAGTKLLVQVIGAPSWTTRYLDR
jgi:hypothetical protein